MLTTRKEAKMKSQLKRKYVMARVWLATIYGVAMFTLDKACIAMFTMFHARTLAVARDESARDESGQSMVEYVLIIALVAVAVIVVLGLFTSSLNNVFTYITNQLNKATP